MERERELKGAIREARNSSQVDEGSSLDALEAELEQVEKSQGKMRDRAEEIMEGEIDSIVAKEGLVVGGLIRSLGIHFPPVDFRLEQAPRVLVVSPRDHIEMIDKILLKLVSSRLSSLCATLVPSASTAVPILAWTNKRRRAP